MMVSLTREGGWLLFCIVGRATSDILLALHTTMEPCPGGLYCGYAAERRQETRRYSALMPSRIKKDHSVLKQS